jgi:hypothetical protein
MHDARLRAPSARTRRRTDRALQQSSREASGPASSEIHVFSSRARSGNGFRVERRSEAPLTSRNVQKAVVEEMVIDIRDQDRESDPAPQLVDVGLNRGAVPAKRIDDLRVRAILGSLGSAPSIARSHVRPRRRSPRPQRGFRRSRHVLVDEKRAMSSRTCTEAQAYRVERACLENAHIGQPRS